MTNQVAAILSGLDYQHLYSWFHVLALLKPRTQVVRVRVEDEDAASADDVTVRHADGSGLPDCYYQIKYHVNQAGHYSTDYLIARKGAEIGVPAPSHAKLTELVTKIERGELKPSPSHLGG